MKKSPDYNLPINPRYGIPALSWSDVLAIESGWFGAKKLQSKALDYGTHIHKMIEHGHYDVPRLGNPETVFQTEIPISPRSKKKFIIIGKVDDHNDTTILDYKTGRVPWTHKKASEHQQFHVYALIKWKATGVAPTKGKLVWLETCPHEDSDSMALTGTMRVFEFPITLLDMLKVQTRFVKAYHTVMSNDSKLGTLQLTQ